MKQRFSKRTRLVSALLTLAMVFTFLPFSALAAGGTHADSTIVLSKQNFPDDAFREYLKKFDVIGNGGLGDNKLRPEERNKVKEINVDGKGIETLEGIEYFSKLEILNCENNKLTNLDVSKNPELKELWCDNNKLTSLDVSKNTGLQFLTCNKNNLTSLDVSKNEKLERLYCYDNQLASLDVTQDIALKRFRCSNNLLSSLDVSKNPALEFLWCFQNQLTSLDVSKNTALEDLDCSQNNLTSLDVSKNTALKYLNCKENKLANLDLSQTAVTALEASDSKIDIYVEETPRTFDLSTLPGAFDVTKASNWVGGTVSGNTLTVNKDANEVTYTYDCGKGHNATFTLNVNVVPDGTVTPPAGGGSTGGGSTGGGDGGGGGAIIVVAGAAAVGLVGYGIYNYVAERQLQALLPEGAAVPENRAQTALLLWNTAGRPEPAAQPAFPDVADPDTAKAAQWCVEHGLMNAKLRGRFAPDGSSPAYKTLNAYRQLVG